jgi:hypothetical protein
MEETFAHTPHESADKILLLKGRPSVRDFIRFARHRSVAGQNCDDVELTKQWQEASALWRHLDAAESGLPELVKLSPLPRSIVDQAAATLRELSSQAPLAYLEHSWSLVELDKVIVWQQYVNCNHTDTLAKLLPSELTAADLLRISAGKTQEPPPVNVSVLNGNTFVFSSPSTDLQVLGTVTLSPENVKGRTPDGHTQTIVGAFIGYGMNVMMALQLGKRLLLINGTHRAYTLRSRGVTHAPCIILHLARSEDIDLVGMPVSREQLLWHFTAARPPLLQDFFDPRLFATFLATRTTQVVQVELKFTLSKLAIN